MISRLIMQLFVTRAISLSALNSYRLLSKNLMKFWSQKIIFTLRSLHMLPASPPSMFLIEITNICDDFTWVFVLDQRDRYLTCILYLIPCDLSCKLWRCPLLLFGLQGRRQFWIFFCSQSNLIQKQNMVNYLVVFKSCDLLYRRIETGDLL